MENNRNPFDGGWKSITLKCWCIFLLHFFFLKVKRKQSDHQSCKWFISIEINQIDFFDSLLVFINYDCWMRNENTKKTHTTKTTSNHSTKYKQSIMFRVCAQCHYGDQAQTVKPFFLVNFWDQRQWRKVFFTHMHSTHIPLNKQIEKQ